MWSSFHAKSAANAHDVGAHRTQSGTDPASLNDLKQGLTDLIERQKEALAGNKEFADAFTTFDLTGLESAEASITKIGQKLNEGGADAGKYALALKKIFGDDGAAQFEVVARNIENAKQKAKEYGLVLSDDVAAKFKELQSTSADFQAKLKGIETIVGGRFVEVFTLLEKSISSIVDDLRNNEDVGAAFETLSTIAERLLISLIPIAETIGKIIGLGAKVIALFGDATGITDKYRASLDEVKESSEQNTQANQNLEKSYVDLGSSIQGLLKQLSNLNSEKQLSVKSAELAAEGERLFVEAQLKAGVISREAAAKRETQIDEELNRKRADGAHAAFAKIAADADTLSNSLKATALASVAADQAASERRKALIAESTQFKIDSQKEIDQAEATFAERSAARAKEVAETEKNEQASARQAARKQDQEELAAIQRLKDAQSDQLGKYIANIQIAANNQSKASGERAKAEQNLSDLQTALNAKELSGNVKLSDDLLKLRQAYFTAKNNLASADQAQNKQRLDDEIKQQEIAYDNLLKALDKSLAQVKTTLAQQFSEIDKSAKAQVSKLGEYSADGVKIFEEAERKKTKLADDAAKVEIARIEQILKTQQLSTEQQEQLQQRLFQAKQGLAQQEVANNKAIEDAKTKDVETGINVRKALQNRATQEELDNEAEILRKVRVGDLTRLEGVQELIKARRQATDDQIANLQKELDAAIALHEPADRQIELQTQINELRQREAQLTDVLKGRTDKLVDSTIQEVNALSQAVDSAAKLGDNLSASANQASQSVKSLYSQASGLQQTFHDSGQDLINQTVEATKAGIAAQLQAEAEAAKIREQIRRQEVADIKAAYKEAADAQTELQEKADEDLASAREKRDEERRQVDHDYAKAKRETERQTALNIIEGLQLIAEANSKYEQEKTAIVKEESERRTEIERQNAEESREIINSTLDGIDSDRDKADSDSYEKHRQYLNDLVDLEKERQGAKTQAEISEIDKRIAAREKEEADRLAKEKQRREKGQALEDEFKDKSKGVTDPELLKKFKEEYDTQKENNDKKNELEDQFQEDYNKALADGNEERAAQIKQAYQDELDRLDAQNKTKLARIQENYDHQKALADAQKAADEAAYQQKLATAEKRHNDEVATIVKNETEKNEKLQEALDDERKRRNRQRERIENEYKESEDRIQNTLQKSLDKVKQQLSDALDAAVGKLNDFGKSGSNAINPLLSQLDQLISKYQQAIGLATSLTGANTGAASSFTGNNITRANSPSSSDSNKITNQFGSGLSNNVTTSPLDSGDSTGNDSSSDSDKDKNGSGKGLAKRVNPGKINSGVPSSANNLTDSPLNSGDQTDSDSGDSDDSDDSDSSGKGPVKQAKTNKVAPGSSQPSFNTNITSTSQQTGDITGPSSDSDADNTDNGELVGTAPSNGFNPVTKQSRIPSGSPKTKSEYIGLMLAIYSAYLPDSPGRFNPALKIVNFTLSFIGDKSKITPEISELMRVATVSLLNRNETDFKSFTSSLADKIDRIVNPKKDQPTNGSPIFTGPGKAPVTQADTPGQTTTPTDANTGPIDDQGDSDAASTGKSFKRSGGGKVSTSKKRDKGKGLDFDSGAESDDDSDSDTTDSSSGADKGNSNGGKGNGKGDVNITATATVAPSIQISLTVTSISGKSRDEFLNYLFDSMVQAVQQRGGPSYKVLLAYRDKILGDFEADLERRGAF